MTSCIDWSSVSGHNAATLCAKISPLKPDMPCVSIKPFLESSQDEDPISPEDDITMPCRSSPCAEGEICTINPSDRRSFQCLPGCLLGEMSKQLIPLDSWAQIPRFDQQTCHKICQCTINGLEKCRDLNCLSFNACWIQSRFVAHRTSFYLECNPCNCFEGEVTCSRKSCGEIRIPTLPCDCPMHYVPVCGRLGVTYASACLAKCSGLAPNEVEYNSCSSNDPCDPNPCGNSERCIRKARVCLSPIHKPCSQFECLPLDCHLRLDSQGPVCDTDNRQHSSLCSMARSGASLAYRGPCLKGCSLKGLVCGINGEVYSSECAAWAEKSVVDYLGPCVTVGLIGDHAQAQCGDVVTCPSLDGPYCLGVTPPGACCPVCGGAARLYYSRKQVWFINLKNKSIVGSLQPLELAFLVASSGN